MNDEIRDAQFPTDGSEFASRQRPIHAGGLDFAVAHCALIVFRAVAIT